MKAVAVVIAPWAPDCAGYGLGSDQKISLVVRSLVELDFEVHLVDSSHRDCGWYPPARNVPIHHRDCPIRLWRPLRLPVRPLGKLCNYLYLHDFPKALQRLCPHIVWTYNSYAYEARLALRLRPAAARFVFELEDMPQARSRGLSPKPWLDGRYLGPMLRQADAVTFVNQTLFDRYSGTVRKAMLLPAIVDDDLFEVFDRPRFTAGRFTVGYFGGLEAEKGADQVLDLVARLPRGFRLVVTGTGSLEPRFREYSRTFPDAIEFPGSVDRPKLVSLMGQCDVILNPHTSIDSMGNGIFPFKVLEAIASGALLVSTRLPDCGLDLSGAVEIYDGALDSLVAALENSPITYAETRGAAVALRQQIWRSYSLSAFSQRVSSLVSASRG